MCRGAAKRGRRAVPLAGMTLLLQQQQQQQLLLTPMKVAMRP
jgi:hypothetical protein